MQKADTPADVIDAYRDVQAARADQETMRNKAEAYGQPESFPKPRGQAAKVVTGRRGLSPAGDAQAEGEAKRFLSVYTEYRKSPDVTRRRMYLETMSTILAPMNKIILDANVGHGSCPICRCRVSKSGRQASALPNLRRPQRAQHRLLQLREPSNEPRCPRRRRLALVLVFWLGTSSFYTVDPTEQVLLLQFDAR